MTDNDKSVKTRVCTSKHYDKLCTYYYFDVSTQTKRAKAALREAEIDKVHGVVEEIKQLLTRLNE